MDEAGSWFQYSAGRCGRLESGQQIETLTGASSGSGLVSFTLAPCLRVQREDNQGEQNGLRRFRVQQADTSTRC